jgi:hypothetical protein
MKAREIDGMDMIPIYIINKLLINGKFRNNLSRKPSSKINKKKFKLKSL